jgi:1,4-dihydroxy-6-naphthoate synthase
MPDTMTLSHRSIRVAHSPDADDAFMFDPLARGEVAVEGLRFEHVLLDIQTLNECALRGEHEVSAISFAAYPEVADRYRLMTCGSSMGEGYGPIVVAAHRLRPTDLRGLRIAVPGLKTSACLALRLCLERDFEAVPVRFDRIAHAVEAGEVDAGLLIHEGQLTYREDGLHLALALEPWWAHRTGGLPLPLGGNVVRRDLGPELARDVTRAVRASIEGALANRARSLDSALRHARGLTRDQADRFVGMYVNRRTVDLGDDGRRAVRLFLEMGRDLGLVPAFADDIDFIEA